MATHRSRGPGRSHDSRSSVWVRVGALDRTSVRQAREALSQPTVRSASSVVVDLAGLDDRHELTGFALLVELNRQVARNGGAVTAVNPPSRLAANLVACHVAVAREALDCPRDALVIEIGTSSPNSSGTPAAGPEGGP